MKYLYALICVVVLLLLFTWMRQLQKINHPMTIGVMLPKPFRKHPAVRALRKRYCRNLLFLAGALLLLLIPPFFFRHHSVILTWYVLWMPLALLTFFVGAYLPAHQALCQLKERSGWLLSPPGFRFPADRPLKKLPDRTHPHAILSYAPFILAAAAAVVALLRAFSGDASAAHPGPVLFFALLTSALLLAHRSYFPTAAVKNLLNEDENEKTSSSIYTAAAGAPSPSLSSRPMSVPEEVLAAVSTGSWPSDADSLERMKELQSSKENAAQVFDAESIFGQQEPHDHAVTESFSSETLQEEEDESLPVKPLGQVFTEIGSKICKTIHRILCKWFKLSDTAPSETSQKSELWGYALWQLSWITALHTVLSCFIYTSSALRLITLALWMVLVLAILLRFRMAVLTERMIRGRIRGETVAPDPDRLWVFGLLYYNPRDRRTILPNPSGVGTAINMAHFSSMLLTFLLIAALLALPFYSLHLAAVEFTPVHLSLTETTLTVTHTDTFCEIPLSEIQSVKLLQAIPTYSRRSGYDFSQLLRGTVYFRDLGSSEVCLDPEAAPFLQITVGNTQYIVASSHPEETQKIYQALPAQLTGNSIPS